MNEQQVNQLLAAMAAQTAAMNRLAESNEAMVALLYESLADDIETTTPIHQWRHTSAASPGGSDAGWKAQ